MTELWRLTATEAVTKLRKRDVSPPEMVEAAALRIEAVEPKINAPPIRFIDEARQQVKGFKKNGRDDPRWLACP
jgi:amidase